MKTLSIIVPVYNEKNTIVEVLRRVFGVKLAGWKKQVIVVDDGSTDGTSGALKNWEKKCTVIYQQKNQGKGAALAAGFKKAHGEIILVQDGDLEYSPNDYPILLAPFDDPRTMVVYGSRFLGSHLSTMYLYALGNKFVTFITNILYNTNITDMETGFKAFRHDVIKNITVTAKRFDVEPQITANLLKAGYQIYEVPISYYGRKFSEGKKLTWRDGVIALWTLLHHRFF